MVTATRERARPLLGTIVRIRVPDEVMVDRAIDAAFTRIATIHRLMSYQERASDLGRIARARAGERLALDPLTAACLSSAVEWSIRSDGVFDPVAAVAADATIADLEFDGETVRPSRPLKLDLSGIAKGFAVDEACQVLMDHGVAAAVVDAGGDLRVLGLRPEEVALRPSVTAQPALVELADGAIASSDPGLSAVQEGREVHLGARNGVPLRARFAAAVAPRCTDADALTKIVLALGSEAGGMLKAAGAAAYLHDDDGWVILGDAA